MLYASKSYFLSHFFLIIPILLLVGCQQEEKTGPLTKSDLIGTKWRLVGIGYGRFEGQNHEYVELDFDEDTSVTLSFDEAFLGGNSFCGTYRVSWQMDEEYGRLTTKGEVAQSINSCSENNQEIEKAFIEIIGGIGFAEQFEGRLEVKSIRGGVAAFVPAN